MYIRIIFRKFKNYLKYEPFNQKQHLFYLYMVYINNVSPIEGEAVRKSKRERAR